MALDTTNPDAVRQAARDILARPEFASRKETWWSRVTYYLTHPLEALNDLLSWVFARIHVSGPTKAIAWVIAIGALLALVVFVVRFQRTTSRGGAVHVHQAPAFAGVSAADLVKQAEECEARGQWRDAVRFRYGALIAQLATAGIVRARNGKTTGEYLLEVRAGVPRSAESFGRATRLFEAVWYGNQDATSDDGVEFKMLTNNVLQEVGQ